MSSLNIQRLPCLIICYYRWTFAMDQSQFFRSAMIKSDISIRHCCNHIIFCFYLIFLVEIKTSGCYFVHLFFLFDQKLFNLFWSHFILKFQTKIWVHKHFRMNSRQQFLIHEFLQLMVSIMRLYFTSKNHMMGTEFFSPFNSPNAIKRIFSSSKYLCEF